MSGPCSAGKSWKRLSAVNDVGGFTVVIGGAEGQRAQTVGIIRRLCSVLRFYSRCAAVAPRDDEFGKVRQHFFDFLDLRVVFRINSGQKKFENSHFAAQINAAAQTGVIVSDTFRVELEESVEVLGFQQVRNGFEVDSGIAYAQRTELGDSHNRLTIRAKGINCEIPVQGDRQKMPQSGSFENSFPPLQQL